MNLIDFAMGFGAGAAGILLSRVVVVAYDRLAGRIRGWRILRSYRLAAERREREMAPIREYLREPDLNRTPWGFSFMGTGMENTETNVTLGETFSGPPNRASA